MFFEQRSIVILAFVCCCWDATYLFLLLDTCQSTNLSTNQNEIPNDENDTTAEKPRIQQTKLRHSTNLSTHLSANRNKNQNSNNNAKPNDNNGPAAKKSRVQKRESSAEKRPSHSLRYDQCGHLARFSATKNAVRCKLEGCTSKTHYYCMKCKVHLCITRENDCFYNFHVLQIEKKTETIIE